METILNLFTFLVVSRLRTSSHFSKAILFFFSWLGVYSALKLLHTKTCYHRDSGHGYSVVKFTFVLKLFFARAVKFKCIAPAIHFDHINR